VNRQLVDVSCEPILQRIGFVLYYQPVNMSLIVNMININSLVSTWPWPWFNLHQSGCIGPHSDAILICFELPPPP